MNKDKILLLFPKVGVNPKYPQPPLSLLMLAPYIEDAGLTPVIVDQRVDNDYARHIRELLPEILFVGITSMTGEQLRYAVELVHLVKSLSPGTPIVFGGIHASLLPEQTIQQKGVNLVGVGEGEAILPDIIRYYQKNLDISDVKGIYYKKDDIIFSTPPVGLLDLETLKLPAWHLIDKSKYTEFGIQCGRGCPYQCTFCYNLKYNHRRWRFRNPETILEEIAFLTTEFGVHQINFLDDNFFTNLKRVEELCELIVHYGIPFKWGTTCRADDFKKFTPTFVDLIKQAGLETLFVGGESGSPKILKKINKGITVDDLISMAEITKKYNLFTVVSFMSGFPFETKEDRYMTYDIMDKISTISPSLRVNGANVYTPYPGNDLFEEAVKKYGLVPPSELTGWNTFVFNMSNLPWLSKAENKMLENISFITRFYFWYKSLEERFLKHWHYPFYWSLRISAIVRWRLRLFKFAYEWDLFRAIRKNFLE
jgi:anaerobic magnesium-protoporphyrin IX monomethyl ester cyclase